MQCKKTKPQLNSEGEAEASPVQPKNEQPAPMGKKVEGRKKSGCAMQNLAGLKVDAWTVIEYAGNTASGTSRWLCQCQCGARRIISRTTLLKLRNVVRFKSCGCYPETTLLHTYTKGCKRSPEHSSWKEMCRRCNSPKSIGYQNYGGRGIKVCDRWQNSFLTFLADMGPKPAGTSIDRINNDGNYEPGNCRWATKAEQVSNMRSNRFVTFNGETKLVSHWAKQYGFSPQNILCRLKMGWSMEDAVSRPLRPHNRHKV